MTDVPNTERLFDLYRMALEEYRFEVRLGWDRTTYFLVLNSALLTLATGVLKLENSRAIYFLTAVLFVLGSATSIIAAFVIKRSHEYYRRTIVKKALIESLLGLNIALPGKHESLNLALETTLGQRDYASIFADPEQWVRRKLRPSSITFRFRLLFFAISAVDLLGAAVSAWAFFSAHDAPVVRFLFA